MDINFSDKDINGGKYLGTGRYPVRITSVVIGQNKSGGPQAIVNFVGLGDQTGKEGREYFQLSDKAKWRFANFAKLCGFTDADLKAFKTEMLHGRVVEIEKTKKGVEVKNGKEHGVYETKFFAAPAELQPAKSSGPIDDLPF